MDLTLVTCNYDTPLLVEFLLKSLKETCEDLPNVVVMNTSKDDNSAVHFDHYKIPYYNFKGGIHGDGVNLAMNKVNTRYMLLVDTDVIFYKDIKVVYDKFVESSACALGNIVGDCGGKRLHPRIEPWFCMLDLHQLNQHKIKFFDRVRTKASKEQGDVIYDIGSTMFEDIKAAGLTVANVQLEGKYFKHYGGMSWREQSYNPNDVDTDIDFGGTHPHKELADIAVKIRKQYNHETLRLNPVCITGVFSK